MDLFGEPTVQVVAATLEAALVLLPAALLVTLSVRVAQLAAPVPALATLRPTAASDLVPPARADLPSGRGLSTSLPTRAPPDPSIAPSPVTNRVAGAVRADDGASV